MTKSISLFYREGSSDKVYQASIEERDGGYVVNFAYGRRGAALTNGSKTSSPVDLPAAQKIFDKIVKEKTGKGYTEDLSGKTFSLTERESKDSGFRCQLANPVDYEQAAQLLSDDRYLVQEKHDGRRVSIVKENGQVYGVNRKGLTVALHEDYNSLLGSPDDFILDGEDMGGHAYVFDCIKRNGQDLKNLPLTERLQALHGVVERANSGAILESITALNTVEKKKLFDRLVSAEMEGVVFKLKNAPYTSGRPASGGSWLKNKFYETASFIVKEVNTQRSVLLALIDQNGKQVSAGNVTIPANHDIPSAGQVVEVRYLYAFKQSGAVFQPVYLGKRTDIDTLECLVSQLKFKV